MKIGIIGNGYAGRAIQLLECDEIEFLVYDLDPEKCSPKYTKLSDLSIVDIIFVCVPTPMSKDGSCDISIVKKAVNDINDIINNPTIVIKSTVIPGTSEKLNTYFMPEFITERNYKEDFINTNPWIIGLKGDKNDELFKNKIQYMMELAFSAEKIQYNNIVFTSTREAEMIKYFRNSMLATKVGFCNEVAELCDILNVDFETVRSLATRDERISEGHTYVPGPDGKKGFGGSCLPKDISALKCMMESHNMKSYILSAVIDRNTQVDRLEDFHNNDNSK